MSEEIALDAADLATVEALRARILEWEDCYDRLAGAFDLHMDILECKAALNDYAAVYYDAVIGVLADRAERRRIDRDVLHAVLTDLLNQLTLLTRDDESYLWRIGGRPLDDAYKAAKRAMDATKASDR